MTGKKMLLLMGLCFAAIWLAAPASASATGWNWYDDDINGEPTTIFPKEVEPRGEFTITSGGVTFGPCQELVITGELYNVPMGVGEGTLLQLLEGGEGCKASPPGCEIEATTFNNLPWNVKLLAEKEVEVTGIEIELHMSAQCQAYGIAATPIVEGWATAGFVAHETHGEETTPTTFVFSGGTGLTVKGSGAAAQLYGLLEFGTKLTSVFI